MVLINLVLTVEINLNQTKMFLNGIFSEPYSDIIILDSY